MQQLHWWFLRPLLQFHGSHGRQALPRRLAWVACWLNSYRPDEVHWWLALGVRSWSALRQHSPESHTAAIHQRRRCRWPDRCAPALRLLSDKAALLRLTPAPWRSPFLVLPSPASSAAAPPWWLPALLGAGLVLKPQGGHASRAVVRFRWCEGRLQQQPLFCRLLADPPRWHASEPPSPDQLLAHWRSCTGSQEPALAVPYLSASSALPPCDPALVVRVITSAAAPDSAAHVRQAWLEIPLAEGPVAFMALNGDALPLPGLSLTPVQQGALNHWQALLQAGPPSSILACLEASITMHSQLPPIDQVAWDWIPASPEPLLLEGNGGFGLLVPQLFDVRIAAPSARAIQER